MQGDQGVHTGGFEFPDRLFEFGFQAAEGGRFHFHAPFGKFLSDLLIKSLQAWPHRRRGPVIQRDIQRQQTDFHMAIPVLSGIHTR